MSHDVPYILSVYSPFSDRVGLNPLESVESPPALGISSIHQLVDVHNPV